MEICGMSRRVPSKTTIAAHLAARIGGGVGTMRTLTMTGAAASDTVRCE